MPQFTIEVSVDIKPTSCPNPLNVKGNGVLPVAILGTEDFDVSQIDPTTVRLSLPDSEEEGPAAIRSNLEDVATPYEGELCGCHTCGPDGLMDMTLKFNSRDVAALLGDYEDGDVVELALSGYLMEAFGGTPIVGADCVVILKKGK